jgi:hypothetical protein
MAVIVRARGNSKTRATRIDDEFLTSSQSRPRGAPLDFSARDSRKNRDVLASSRRFGALP